MRLTDLPRAVREMGARGEGWAAWVEALPRLLTELLEEWDLAPDGAPGHGFTSVVLPVRAEGGDHPGDGAGGRAVLKLAFPDRESEHEALALQRWHGDGAVLLLRADPRRRALLLERLEPAPGVGPRDLSDVWDLDACGIVGGLYRRLHRPAPPQLRPLVGYVEEWTGRLTRLPRGAPVPRRLVEQAVALGRAFVADPASSGTLIHGDLHYANVLAAQREPWLAIDPKPVDGDPHYEVAPLLWNRWDEVVAHWSGVRDAVRQRFETVVEAAGLDRDRARDWVVVRELHVALWAIEGQDGVTPDEARETVTRCIAIAKAVQD